MPDNSNISQLAKKIPFPLALVGGWTLVSVPAIFIYVRQLDTRDYYGFWPFAFVATFGFIFFRSSPTLVFEEVSGFRWFRRISLLILALLAFAASWAIGSIWPVFVGYVIGFALILDFAKEATTSRSLIYLILPLTLVVRPPVGLDELAVQQLQRVTSAVASEVLNKVGLEHVLAGNTIQPFQGEPLLVEEACSGVQSLFTLMFVAVFWATFRKYTLPRTMLLAFSAVLWAVVMNVFRVFSIAMAATYLQLDLTSGWKHELLGYVAVLGASLLLLCNDRVLHFLLHPIEDNKAKQVNPLIHIWNQCFQAPLESQAMASTTTNKLVRMTAVGSFVLLTMLVISSTLALDSDTSTNMAGRVGEPDIDENWLPDGTMKNCKLVNFEKIERQINADFGQYSSQWIVESPIGPVLNSIDYSFYGWHDLTVCYAGTGWKLTKLESKYQPGSKWPIAYAEFLKPSGERAILLQSMFTYDGEPLVSEAEKGVLASIRNRMQLASANTLKTRQVQTLYEFVSRAEDAVAILEELHMTVREQLRSRAIAENSVAHKASLGNGND